MMPRGGACGSDFAELSAFGECTEIVSRALDRHLPRTRAGLAFRQELGALIARHTERDAGGPSVARLPALTCAAAGGEPDAAAAVMYAWQLVRLAAKLLDDIEDGDADGNTAVAINAANGLIFAAQLIAADLTWSRDGAGRLSQELPRAMLRAAAGQHADLKTRQTGAEAVDPDAWLEIAGKSGELFGWAAFAGATVAGAAASVQDCFREYGYHLGVLVQVADDFRDVWGREPNDDLRRASFCLPVCYARFAAKASVKEQLEALLDRAARGDEGALVESRQMLVDLGGQSFVLTVAQMQHRQAVAALRETGCGPGALEPLVALSDQAFPALGRVGA